MKKVMTIVLSLILVLAVLPFTVSARNLTAEETALIQRIAEKEVLPDGTFGFEQKDITQAENYLRERETALTADQIARIEAVIAEGHALVKSTNTGDAHNWSQEVRQDFMTLIDRAVKIVDEQLSARGASSAAGGTGTVTETGTTTETGDGTTTTYSLVAADGTKPAKVTRVQVGNKTLTESEFTYDATTGTVTLNEAPETGSTVSVDHLTQKEATGLSSGGFIEIVKTTTDPTTGEVTEQVILKNDSLEKEDTIIKPTGSNVEAFVIAGVCGMIVLAACAFVSKKVELF